MTPGGRPAGQPGEITVHPVNQQRREAEKGGVGITFHAYPVAP
jgi:hypothetical protein